MECRASRSSRGLDVTDREFWLAVRQAALMFIDALERWLGIAPRTAELRKERRGQP
jgi:hypothetical protein